MCLMAICISSSKEYPFLHSPVFKGGGLFVFWMELHKLCVLQTNFVCQYFSYSEGCLCWVSFAAQMPLRLIRSSFLHLSSVTQLRQALCNPMDCSTPGLHVHHQFLEFTQIHVHLVGDAIQASHLLSSHSPPAFDLSQHQGLFK